VERTTDSLSDAVAAIATQCGFEVTDRAELPGRNPKYLPTPAALQPAVRSLLLSRHPTGLYSHQAQAIDSALAGNDVCLSTSTASGKSLVFVTVAADLLQREPGARVLALYPAKALIHDQQEKWRQLLNPLRIPLGHIDGDVSHERRSEILRNSRVLLMTPDTVHAWLMSHLNQPEVEDFLTHLRLLVLDEAHVYDGVFGTNMAYLLRRLQTVAGPFTIISSTATLGTPGGFLQQLTGREPRIFAAEEDGSGSAPRTVLLADGRRQGFKSTVNLLRMLARLEGARFLAFGDSRAMVEQLVAATHRSSSSEDEEDDADDSELDVQSLKNSRRRVPRTPRVLPYRAGYEGEDRQGIQKALESGQLAGVVSTSAMELGIDIGEIDLVVLLNVPPTAKAFWQRLGRAGRRRAGVCLMIDTSGALALRNGPLQEYLKRPLEPSWFYLENRYLQYANAICAAFELRAAGLHNRDTAPFNSLPVSFRKFLDNELNPSGAVAPDLYPLRQRAAADPHRGFPLRTGAEPNFRVKGPHGLPLGSLSYPQALREAYPGAIYYYMARSYRVFCYHYGRGEILVRRERHWTTQPIVQAMVFPRFNGGIRNLWRSDVGFVAEVEVQVSERVLGFVERRGSTTEEHRYGPPSPYHQRELNRLFETTGVCWYFPEGCASDTAAAQVMETYCEQFGVQARDVGFGRFHAKTSPLRPGTCQGFCIFDATIGSLRLTQKLGERFAEVVRAAGSRADADSDAELRASLLRLADQVAQLSPATVQKGLTVTEDTSLDWTEVIAPGQKAMLRGKAETQTVEVLGHRSTPHGLMYELVPPRAGVKWLVAMNQLEPLYGNTAMLRVNPTAGGTAPVV
jgi:DEAD/DEAH box helicase domain-containing protein